MIMVNLDGFINSMNNCYIDFVVKIIECLGLEKIMFEVNDLNVFEWFIQNYGFKVSNF